MYISALKYLFYCFKKGKTNISLFQLFEDPLVGHLRFRGEARGARSDPKQFCKFTYRTTITWKTKQIYLKLVGF